MKKLMVTGLAVCVLFLQTPKVSYAGDDCCFLDATVGAVGHLVEGVVQVAAFTLAIPFFIFNPDHPKTNYQSSSAYSPQHSRAYAQPSYAEPRYQTQSHSGYGTREPAGMQFWTEDESY